MSNTHENPEFINVKRNSLNENQLKNLKEDIIKLSKSQPFAVLATQGKDRSNASLISFAISSDLKQIVFATPKDTEKFVLIKDNKIVSVLIDDRTIQQDNINQISALTILGKAKILSDKNEYRTWSSVLIEKHPNLQAFVEAKTTSIVVVEVNNYIYVNKFQDVKNWDPR